ncbi:hypothetical protein [Sphingomonas sp. BK069]|uniref:hypothetical protein n=1 Tax=Sphingomonas sp. BK069 TaxID=2586979 RepID=UPI00160CCE8F|nr:hypothetical protein [Sphingomonas sp. BK069]MBB3348377.1 hypothetical protein [Sphingomonas sp. BK069]
MEKLEASEIARLLSAGERRIMAAFPDAEASSEELGTRGTLLAALCHWLPRRRRRVAMTALLLKRFDEDQSRYVYSLSDMGMQVRASLRADATGSGLDQVHKV